MLKKAIRVAVLSQISHKASLLATSKFNLSIHSCSVGRLFSTNPEYLVSIDQGTTSSRALVLNSQLKIVGLAQREHEQITPKPGWVQHNPLEIYERVCECVGDALSQARVQKSEVAGVGITNQRETTVAWRRDGTPLHNALVWLDARTQGVAQKIQKQLGGDPNVLSPQCGLPINTYFSGVKMRWLIENVPEVRAALKENDCLFGTIDSFLIYKATKGKHFATDVTNASRTMMMDLRSLQWKKELADNFHVPLQSLAQILPCGADFGTFEDQSAQAAQLKGLKIRGVIGDQHAAALGHMLKKGEAKNTYGTGCFLIVNTGTEPDFSSKQLLTTLSWKLSSNSQAFYAVQGAVETAGSALRWARDQLHLFQNYGELRGLLSSVAKEGSGGVVFVPAFNGLFAPYWRQDARGVLVGLSQHSNRAHVIRAIFQAVCFRTKEVLDAAQKVTPLTKLKVDGGMTKEPFLLQNQANVLGIPVQTQSHGEEVTAVGAAIAAGLETKIWKNLEAVKPLIKEEITVRPEAGTAQMMKDAERRWKRAVEASYGWAQ